MKPAASDVADAEDRLPERLPLHGEVPIPCRRIFEIAALSGDGQWQVVCAGAAGVVDVSKRHVSGGLEGRVATEEHGITDAQAREIFSSTRAKHRLIVHLPGDTQARLELAILNL